MHAMLGFTSLERAAIEAILGESGESRATIARQLLHSVVLSRENTGGGFFTEIEVGSAVESPRVKGSFGENVWMSIDGLEYGLGMILHFKDGRASLLEGYAVGPEDTSSIDFGQARFVVADAPGPLPPNVR